MDSTGPAVNGDEIAASSAAVDSGTSALLLSSPLDRTDSTYCDLLREKGPVTDQNLLTVTLDETVDQVTDRYLRCEGMLPDRFAVVTVGDTTRGAVAASGGSESSPVRNDSVSTASISSPGDLTGLGIKLSQCLSSWDGDEKPTTVQFDSLTTLLQFADLKRVFRFVHVLIGRIASADAVGYFHLDPAAHDDQTLATLRGLFDVTFELSPDGTWRES